MFGGKRTPLSGGIGGGDLSMPSGSIWADWSWEAKRRAKLPALMVRWLSQAETDIAIGDPRRPALVMREDNGKAIVAMYAADLIAWAEALAEIGNASKVRGLLRQAKRVIEEAEGAIR